MSWRLVQAALVAGALGLLRLPGGERTAFAQVHFVEEALARGLLRTSEPPAAAAIPATVTASLPYQAALADLDGDGDLDYFAINHGQYPHLSGLWLNQQQAGFGQNLYTVAVSGRGLDLTGWMTDPVDLDVNGVADLLFLGWSEYALYCPNQGVSSQSGWTGPTFACAVAAYPDLVLEPVGDVNGDGLPDVRTRDPDVPFDNYVHATHGAPFVWRLNDGTANVAAWPVARDPFAFVGTAAMSKLLLDIDADGLPDRLEGIPAAADQRGPFGVATAGTRLLLGRPGGTYVEAASGLGTATDPLREIEDINEDGCLDLGFDQTSYKDNSRWYLQDRTAAGGCAAHFHAVAGTSPELPYFPGYVRTTIDVDNSGLPAKVVLVQDAYSTNEGYAAGVHVFQKQPDGSYTEIADHGIAFDATYYMMLTAGDWNGDGLVDLAGIAATSMAGTDQGIGLWTNRTTTTNRWLDVTLPTLTRFSGVVTIEIYAAGRAGDRSALVSPPVTTFAGHHWPTRRYHFGVGARDTVDVRVTFPGGPVIVHSRVATNGTVPVDPSDTAFVETAPSSSSGCGPCDLSNGAGDATPGRALWLSLALGAAVRARRRRPRR